MAISTSAGDRCTCPRPGSTCKRSCVKPASTSRPYDRSASPAPMHESAAPWKATTRRPARSGGAGVMRYSIPNDEKTPAMAPEGYVRAASRATHAPCDSPMRATRLMPPTSSASEAMLAWMRSRHQASLAAPRCHHGQTGSRAMHGEWACQGSMRWVALGLSGRRCGGSPTMVAKALGAAVAANNASGPAQS
eukprot:scaffold14272_cov99-Isochrysis_galbana.AAC.3